MQGPEGREPDSVFILHTKNEKEKEYLQRTIIMMELKQLAESITMIAFRKKLRDRSDRLKFKNRPLVWQERIDIADKSEKKGGIPIRKLDKKVSNSVALLHAQFNLD
jgi:hypothetical protein